MAGTDSTGIICRLAPCRISLKRERELLLALGSYCTALLASSSGVLCCQIKFRVRLLAALCLWVGIGIGTVRSGWVCCVSSIYRPEKEGWSGKSESSNATARLCDVMRVTTPDAILLSLAPLLLPEAVPTSTMSPGLIFVAGMAKPPACINTA